MVPNDIRPHPTLTQSNFSVQKSTGSRLELAVKLTQKMLLAYLMPEYPIKGATIPTLLALQKAGATMVEIGMPHSDPLADGPVIQAAAYRAIENGLTIKTLLPLIAEARQAGLSIPVILMGYINPVFTYGVEAFCNDAAKAGADGLILPDLPPEESSDVQHYAEKNGLAMTYLISPSSSDERMQCIDRLSTFFSYCLTVNSVTGSNKLSATNDEIVSQYLKRVRANTLKKFVAGFGISTPETYRAVINDADGAVVGSALLKAITPGTTPHEIADLAESFLRHLLSPEKS